MKDEDEDMEEKAGLKKEEEDDDDDEDGKNSKIEGEELQVRDVQYKLETLFLNDPESSLSLVIKSHQPVKVMPLVSLLPWSIAPSPLLEEGPRHEGAWTTNSPSHVGVWPGAWSNRGYPTKGVFLLTLGFTQYQLYPISVHCLYSIFDWRKEKQL